MSTPSKKPSYPIELSDYLTRKERERGDPQPDPVESDRPEHLRTGTPPNAPGLDLGGASAYAPKQTKPTTFSEPNADPRADAQQRAIDAAEEATGDQVPLCPDNMPGGPRAKNRLDPDPAVSLQPRQAPADRQPAPPDGERQDAAIDDRDLERLEASVRWLQRRQAAAMRLPRATGLPLLRSPLSDALVGGVSRDPDETLRSPLRSLEPTRLKPPPLRSDRNPNAILAVAVACSLMAGGVYWLMLAGPSPSFQATSKSQIAAVTPPPPASTMQTVGAAQLEGRAPSAPDAEISVEADQLLQRAAAPPAASTPQHETVALRPAAADAQSSAPGTVRALDPEEISLLIKQGEKHITAGDVVTARMIFQRAAKAGDATAALALAATYDPIVLAKLGVMGMGADVEQARIWYRMAESYGSAEAKQRLRRLDNQ